MTLAIRWLCKSLYLKKKNRAGRGGEGEGVRRARVVLALALSQVGRLGPSELRS